MQRSIALLIAGFFMAVAPAALASPDKTTQHLEHLMVDNADTPAEH